MERRTARLIEDITDEGLFEHLGTAILRSADALRYSHLTHPGVNADGRTVAGPLDAVAVQSRGGTTVIVIAEFTTTRAKDLRRKWLSPNDPVGDLHKALKIVAEERARMPGMQAMVALCCAVEPSQDLTRDVTAVAVAADVELDIWTRERLSDYLDYETEGQYLRHAFFGTAVDRLSATLLSEISRAAVKRLPGDIPPGSLIDRAESGLSLDAMSRPVAFIVGDSGCGKTVSAYQLLASHVAEGGYGFVLPDTLLETGTSLERTLTHALQRAHPSLTNSCGAEALALCSMRKPLLLIVEDINTVGNPTRAIETILGWYAESLRDNAGAPGWRVICPVWPAALQLLREDRRRRADQLAVPLGALDRSEGRELVLRRAGVSGVELSALMAESMAEALGNDALLIALSSLTEGHSPHEVIQVYIDSACRQLADGQGTRVLDDYRAALRSLSVEMLQRRNLAPTWSQAIDWLQASTDGVAALRELVKQGTVIRVVDSVLRFRHDRVRLSLLADAIARGLDAGSLPEDVLGDAGYAEAVGHALVAGAFSQALTRKVVAMAPLAGFVALKVLGTASRSVHKTIADALSVWLSDANRIDEGLRTLRWEALRVLAQTDSHHAGELVQQFRDRGWATTEARFRHGDLDAGVHLCGHFGPGVRYTWRDSLINHVWHRYQHQIEPLLADRLSVSSNERVSRVGELHLAGFARSRTCLRSIIEGWHTDPHKRENLSAYLWAATQCEGDGIQSFLSELCATWATLPNTSDESSDKEQRSFPLRHAVVLDDLQWGVARGLSAVSLQFLLARAGEADLHEPIKILLKHVDHPDVVTLLVNSTVTAERKARAEGFALFPFGETSDLLRRKYGQVLSVQSSAKLVGTWNDLEQPEDVRIAAFRYWSTRVADGDIARYCTNEDGLLADEMLRTRLDRGDASAARLLGGRVHGSLNAYWWQYGRYAWCPALTEALADALDRVAGLYGSGADRADEASWILAELVTRRSPQEIEALLVPRWTELSVDPRFVQAALFASTTRLRSMVADVLGRAKDPRAYLQLIASHWGVHTARHPGVTRVAQLEGLVPYLNSVEVSDLNQLWEVCNERGWLEFRRSYLDSLVNSKEHKSIVDVEGLHAKLDEDLRCQHRFPLHHWVDRCLLVGWNANELLDGVDSWLSTKGKSVDALTLGAELIRHLGARADIERIQRYASISDAHAAVVRDARFAVARRTLQ